MIPFRKIVEFIQAYIALPKDRRAALFAYVMVPLAVMPFIYVDVFGVSPFTGHEEQITVIPLATEISANGKVLEDSGVIIIIEPDASPFAIAMKNCDRSWTSLSLTSAEANKTKITTDGGRVFVASPLLGESRPVAVVSRGSPGSEVLLPKIRMPVSAFTPVARRSVPLTFSVVIAAAFAFGLSTNRGHEHLVRIAPLQRRTCRRK